MRRLTVINFSLLCTISVIYGTGGLEHNNSNSPTAQLLSGIKQEIEDAENIAQIHGTIKQLIDTAHIRDEINSAVKQKSFIHSGIKQTMTPDEHTSDSIIPKLDFFKFLLGNTNLGSTISPTSESAELLGAQLPKNDEYNESTASASNVGQNLTNYIRTFIANTVGITAEPNIPIIPNVVDSSAIKYMKTKPKESEIDLHLHNRESLKLVSVTEDLTFSLGVNVVAWKTIRMISSKNHILIGITKNSILLVLEQENVYKTVHQLALDAPISTFIVFMKWNGNILEGNVVVAIENQLVFIRIDETLEQMFIIWKWNVQELVRTMSYFQIDGSDFILLINDINTEHTIQTTADIHRFNLNNKHSWLIQKIPLQNPCKNVQFLDIGHDYVICFSQNDTAELFKYSYDAAAHSENYQRFTHFETILSPKIQTLSSFQIGGLTYLAIGGQQPQILRYYREQFHLQTILSTNWGIIEKIVPIPARTYRDDLILLVQHRIHFDGHSLLALEALIWNGEAFESTASSVPCNIGNVATTAGLTCVIDPDRTEGIDGSSIIQHGNNISLLVPRFNAPSGLFRLEFELISVQNQDMSALTSKYQLSGIMSENNKSIVHIESSISNSLITNGLILSNYNINTLKTNALEITTIRNTTNDDIWFGDHIWEKKDRDLDISELLSNLVDYNKQLSEFEMEDSRIPLKIITHSPSNGQFNIKNLRIFRGKRDSKLLTLSKLMVDQLYVDYINDAPTRNFIFTDAVVLKESTFHSKSDFIVNDKVDLTTFPEIVQSNSLQTKNTTLAESQIFENIHVTGHVNVDVINGVKWTDLTQEIVLTNLPNSLHEMHVQGDMYVPDAILISKLKNHTFPNDYLWNSTDIQISIIRGPKTIIADLHTNEIDTNGLIDGISTSKIITLSGNQNIVGATTFQQLEVSEKLHVSGNISGKFLGDFLPNLNLQQSKFIQTDCQFHNLQVDGSISIQNQLDSIHIDIALADVIYKNTSRIICSSFKTFEKVDCNQFELSSNLINGIKVENYVSAITEQTLNIDRLNGNLFLRSVNMQGLFDFINITELDENSVKLFGDQYTEAELSFETDDFELEAENLEILNVLNSINLHDLVSVGDYLEFNGNVILEGALVDELIVISNFDGKRIINGELLDDLELNRLSYRNSQEIPAEYLIKTLVIKGDLNADYGNGYFIRKLLTHVTNTQQISDFLLAYDTPLAQLTIGGSVDISKINNNNMEVVKANAIYLNKPNVIAGKLRFLDHIHVSDELNMHQVFSTVFNNFAAGLMSRNELDNAKFFGPKILSNGFEVRSYCDANQLGELGIATILTKNSRYSNIVNSLIICGNLLVRNVQSHYNLNNVNFGRISNAYKYDTSKGTHIMKTFGIIDDKIEINELVIHSNLNMVSNIKSFILSVVKKDSSQQITGTKKFIRHNIAVDNLTIETFNDIHQHNFLSQIIINQNIDQKIFGNIAFENITKAKFIQVKANMFAKNIEGCILREWVTNSIRCDHNVELAEYFLFANGSFQASHLQAIYLNEILMITAVTRHSQQNVLNHQYFSTLYSNAAIEVRGLVNGLNLRLERDNTVMVNGNQHIAASTVIQYSRVLNALQTLNTINGHNFRFPATLNGELLLHGPISFTALTFDSLHTNEDLSGIDLNYWTENTLQKRRKSQVITGKWIVDNLNIVSPIVGSNTLNGYNLNELSNHLNDNHMHIGEDLLAIKEQYRDTCADLNQFIYKRFQYSLSYFKESFNIVQGNGVISSIFSLDVNAFKYFAINVGCFSTFYKWNGALEKFEKKITVESGSIKSWIQTLDKSYSTYLVTNSYENSNCTRTGTIIWKFDGDLLTPSIPIAEIGKYSLLHVDNTKRPPTGSFYALENRSDSVVELNILGNIIEEWHLPVMQSDQINQFRFIPAEVNLGLALSDGIRLSRLSATKKRTQNYQTGSSLDHLAMESMANLNEKKKYKRFFTKQIQENLKNTAEKFANKQREWLESMNGPFQNISIIPSEPRFLNGIFNQGGGQSLQFTPSFGNTSLIKLKLFPSDKIPLSETDSIVDNQDINQFPEVGSSEPRTDIFGVMEEIIEPIADVITDDLVDIQETIYNNENQLEPDTDQQENKLKANLIASSSKEINHNEENQANQNINQFPEAGSSEPRTDIFGVMEEIIEPIADVITDDLVDIQETLNNNENQLEPDTDQQENILKANLIGSNSKEIQHNEEIQTRTDLFGVIENIMEPIADRITDKIVDVQEQWSSDKENNNVFGDSTVQNALNAHSTRPTVFETVGENVKKNSDDIPNDQNASTNTAKGQTIYEPENMRHFESETQLSQDQNFGGILNIFKNSIKDVQITYDEGKQRIDGLRQEINNNDNQNDRDNKYSHHEQRHRFNNVIGRNTDTESVDIPEPKIATEILSEGGVATTENINLPGLGSGQEIITLYVGSEHRRTLVAVSALTDHTVKGSYDNIRIYEDVIEGRVFQIIACYKPRSLAAVQLRDETILAFLEMESNIKIYIYRGIEGFRLFSQFSYTSYVSKIQAISLPTTKPYLYTRTYLIICMKHEIHFLEAITNGYNGLDVHLNCE